MVRKQMEGDNRQRRKAAGQAKDEGLSPSEAGVTTGASKQQRHLKNDSSHRERVENPDRGKLAGGRHDPGLRPGSGIPEQQPR
jgi:hypothetical protein